VRPTRQNWEMCPKKCERMHSWLGGTPEPRLVLCIPVQVFKNVHREDCRCPSLNFRFVFVVSAAYTFY